MLIEAENSEYPAAPVNPYRKLLGLCWQLLTHSKSIFLKVVLTWMWSPSVKYMTICSYNSLWLFDILIIAEEIDQA